MPLETIPNSSPVDKPPRQIAVNAFILLLPFLMFHQVMPFLSDRTFGFEYPLFSIQKQMELMFSIKAGSYPLFVPGFYGGLSSAGLSMGEIIHPVAHIAAILPGYWGGRALEWNTFLRLFSLGLAQLALFVFLRRLKLPPLPAFLVSLITTYNMCMLVLFYYGCSMETWTGFLFLIAAIGACCMNPDTWRHPLAITGATFWTIASGHPQMIYFALIGSIFIAAILPAYLRQLNVLAADRHREHRAFYFKRLTIGMAAGLMLSAAYWLPFYFEIVVVNAGRVDQGYAWSIVGNDTFIGTLNNFFNPFRSGSSLFGGSPLFLVAALIPLLLLAKIRPPRVIWILWTAALIVFLYLQGPRTPVHYIFWKYIPLAGAFRIPGRMALLLPVFLMLLIVWLLRVGESPRPSEDRSFCSNPPALPAWAALGLTVGYLFIPQSLITDPSAIWPVNEMAIPFGMERLYLAISIVILAALIVGNRGKRIAAVCFAGMVLLSLVQIKCLLYSCAHTVRDIRMPTFEEMLREKQERLAYRPYPGPGMGNQVIMRQLEKAFIEPFLGKVYFEYQLADNNDDAYRMLEAGRAADTIIIEDLYHDMAYHIPDLKTSSDSAGVKLIYSSFNRLVFDAHAVLPAFFGMAYPITGQWRATVNGQTAQIYRANGASHAIGIPEGDSRVEFRFESSSAFMGMLIGCLTYALIFTITAMEVFPGNKGRRIALCAFVIGIAGFTWWWWSLYHGNNLGTRYVWKPPPRDAPINRAYAASVRTSSQWPVFPELYNGARAVDGDRTPGKGFITELEDNPWVLVDLGYPCDIESIRIYESRNGPRPIELYRPDDPALSKRFGYTWNLRPLMVSVSTDGERWLRHSIQAERSDQPLEWELPKFSTVRYIHVQTSGLCRLSIEEIEAYARRR